VLEWGSVDTNAFLQPVPAGEIAGFPAIRRRPCREEEPGALWTPLPLGTALDLVATARQAALAGERESVGRFEDALAKVRDPARRAERMKDVTAAAASMPNPAAFIAQMEEALRVEETAILEALGPKGSSTNSAPQVLIITPIERCFNTADKFTQEANSALPAGCPANRRHVETVDRDALLAWLR
jgi:hypothetical protein